MTEHSKENGAAALRRCLAAVGVLVLAGLHVPFGPFPLGRTFVSAQSYAITVSATQHC